MHCLPFGGKAEGECRAVGSFGDLWFAFWPEVWEGDAGWGRLIVRDGDDGLGSMLLSV